MNKGILFVVSAPAGCGKDTILEQVLLRNDNLFYSVSATTRGMREGEKDGVSYFFKTREEIEDMIANAQLLEYTEYCGNYYGTPKKAVVDMLEQGKDVILKIEIEGAANVKKMFPEATLIFILPPSMNELSRRLHKRGTEDEATIAKRLETARKELAFAKNYDYAIVNGDLDKAIDDFMAVISAEKFTVKRNLDLIQENGG